MYDYSTRAMQVQIYNELDVLNTNVLKLDNTLHYVGFLIVFIGSIFLIKGLVKKCLGGR